MPVWIEVGIVSLAFLVFGTREETYLSLYAAGVFILLSMTGWAVVKRLLRMLGERMETGHILTLSGSGVAASLTTGATLIIFAERLKEGAWTYFLFIPALYAIFDHYRKDLGDPTPLEEKLGSIEESMWSTKAIPPGKPETIEVKPAEVEFTFFEMTPERLKLWARKRTPPKHIIVPLDGASLAEQALPVAEALHRVYKARVTLVSVVRWRTMLGPVIEAAGPVEAARVERDRYLKALEKEMKSRGVRVDHVVGVGPVAETLNYIAGKVNADLVVMTTRGRSGLERWSLGSKASKILQITDIPVLLVRPSKEKGVRVRFRTLLVPLDGSEFSERILPYVRAVDPAFVSKVILLTVPIVPEPELYGTMADVVESFRLTAEKQAYDYLNAIARVLRKDGIDVEVMVAGTDPATTMVEVSDERDVDLVMVTSHGRGGYDPTSLGKVADRVIHGGNRPTFLLPIQEKRRRR
jgi:nucleotide-binding universal stress UspA family protein